MACADLQRHLIGAFEWFCATKYPALAKDFHMVLKVLYDEDLVEEEVFLDWHMSPCSEYTTDPNLVSTEKLENLRSKATPFIN